MVSGKNRLIRILIVDACEIVREGLRAIINRQTDMTIIGEAGDGRGAVEQFRRLRPDVSLIELILPLASGFEAMAAIRKDFPQSRLLVLTSANVDENLHRALQSGALSFLPKSISAKHLLEAIRAAYLGQWHMHSLVANHLMDHMAGSVLTRRELEVLGLIAKGKSNKRIGAALGITEGTVKSHVSSIMGKLDASDRTEAVTIALQRGLLSLN